MASEQLLHSDSSPRSSAGTVACTPCRRIKMRCVVDAGVSRCNRCNRKNLDCFFESHRRGRRPGSKIKKSPKVSPTQIPQQIIGELHLKDHSQQSHSPRVLGGLLSPEHSESTKNESSHHQQYQHPKRQQHGESLAPAGLLSAEAVTGSFSLENVLKFPGSKSRDQSQTPKSPEQPPSESDLDPTRLGLVSVPIARNLFDSFMNYLNPYVAHLDPLLHTFEFLQHRSSFLLTVVLCTAARIFNESVHSVLRDHAEKLLGKFIISGEKSTEGIQAMLLLTYWKDRTDSRSWHFVGHAIRMALAMNWHKLSDTAPTTEMEIRVQRNKERTWLILFVYDRSISLQQGRPWMQHADPFIRKAGDWHRKPFAVPGNDHLLIAFLQLRMIGADNLDFWPSASSSDNAALERCLNGYFEELESWEMAWCENCQDVSRPVDFMIKFYGAHFRLLLSSSRLQLAQQRGDDRLDDHFQSCLTSGDYIFRVLLDKLAPFQQLYYVQDSIHVMIAYTTILLIKILLLSENSQVTPSLERSTTETILEASDVFAAQSSALRPICVDQARFLKSAVKDYRRWKRQDPEDQKQAAPKSTEWEATAYHLSQNETPLPVGATPQIFDGQHGVAGPSTFDYLNNGSPVNDWESFFDINASAFEFDNWSLLPLSVPM